MNRIEIETPFVRNRSPSRIEVFSAYRALYNVKKNILGRCDFEVLLNKIALTKHGKNGFIDDYIRREEMKCERKMP